MEHVHTYCLRVHATLSPSDWSEKEGERKKGREREGEKEGGGERKKEREM